jgi:uncharacterized membrane protein
VGGKYGVNGPITVPGFYSVAVLLDGEGVGGGGMGAFNVTVMYASVDVQTSNAFGSKWSSP